MDNDQITALAREYAEEINPVNRLNDYPEAKMIADMMRNALSEVIDEKIKDFEGFVRFLLRRYALVEKSKLEAIRFRKVYSADDVRSKFTEECLIDALFPEIAKEVES